MSIEAGDTAYVAYGYEHPEEKIPFYYAIDAVVRRPPIDVPKDEHYYFKHHPPRDRKYVFETMEEADAMVNELIERFGGKLSSYGSKTLRTALQRIEEETS